MVVLMGGAVSYERGTPVAPGAFQQSSSDHDVAAWFGVWGSQGYLARS